MAGGRLITVDRNSIRVILINTKGNVVPPCQLNLLISYLDDIFIYLDDVITVAFTVSMVRHGVSISIQAVYVSIVEPSIPMRVDIMASDYKLNSSVTASICSDDIIPLSSGGGHLSSGHGVISHGVVEVVCTVHVRHLVSVSRHHTRRTIAGISKQKLDSITEDVF